ncbi:hypothetical protein [Candidatus Uabimicrobium sp. HlEnr_7]|uniref:hypothetical protein n=1 Tax=Candidatus Uabimicrobium helgolandensis TaxID=3095367 RepID=UPI003556BA62
MKLQALLLLVVSFSFFCAQEKSTVPVKKSLYKIELLGVANKTAFIKLYKYHNDKYYAQVCAIKTGKEIKAKTIVKPKMKTLITFSPGWKLLEVKMVIKKIKKTQGKTIMKSLPAIIYEDEKQKRIHLIRKSPKQK